MAGGDDSSTSAQKAEQDFSLERYKYILQQINAANEYVYRFLAIYQTLAVALVGGALALFVGYRKWQIPAPVARSGIVGVMWLVTIIAAFVTLLIIIGILNWLDYRHEECDLTDTAVRPGFRKRPQSRNFFRWYETYIVLFIAGSIIFLWICTFGLILPAMK